MTLSILCIGIFLYSFGLYANLLKEKLYFSESLVSLIFGVFIGPLFLDLGLEINNEKLLFQLCRVVLDLQILSVSLSLHKNYLKENLKSLSLLILPITLLMTVFGFVVFLVTGLSLRESFLIGVCAAPTDPVLVSGIFKGKFADQHIPSHLRTLLAVESGLNDGIAVPLLYLPLVIHVEGTLSGIGKWITDVILFDILLPVMIGVFIGFWARKLLIISRENDWIDKESLLSSSIFLLMIVVGMMNQIQANEFIGIFAAGSAFSYDDWFYAETLESNLQEIIDLVFHMTFFIYIGSCVPWSQIQSLSWKVVAGCTIVVLFRRLPSILFLWSYIPAIENIKEALFVGWFGPVGVGGLYYALSIVDDIPNGKEIFCVMYLMLLISTLFHGITVALFHLTITRRLTLEGVLPDFEYEDESELVLN